MDSTNNYTLGAVEDEGALMIAKTRAMVLKYQPELTHSVWIDTFISDSDGCDLPRCELIERLKQGVRDGEWAAWRLITVDMEVFGNEHSGGINEYKRIYRD